MSESAQNMANARQALETINERGIEAAIETFHPEFLMTTTPEFATEPDTYRGQDGVRRWFSSFYEAMDRIRIEAVEMHEAGSDQIAIVMDLTARGRSSGLESTQRAVMLCRLDDGLLRQIDFFAELETALAEGRSR